MKPPEHNTPSQPMTTVTEVMHWHESLLQLHARLACFFARPEPYARLLSQASWDVNGVRDEIRAFALEHVGHTDAIVVIDETSFPKRGTHSAGVKKQYCGTTGRVENCQVGVFLSYVTTAGHTLLDRELYLPHDWLDDPVRCQHAGIPPSLPFPSALNRIWPS